MALAPQLPAAYVSLIEAARRKKDRNLARGAAHQLVRIAPEWATSHYLLGQVDLDAKRNTDAVVHFREALKLDPESRVAHNDLGVASLRLGDRKQALQSFSTAAQLDPRDQTAANNLRLMARQEMLPMHRWSRYHVVLLGPGLIVAAFTRLTRRRSDIKDLPESARTEITRMTSRDKAIMALMVSACLLSFGFLVASLTEVQGPFYLPVLHEFTRIPPLGRHRMHRRRSNGSSRLSGS